MYVNNSYTSLVNKVIPQGEFDLVCICSQFSFSQNDTITGYQVVARDVNDFIMDKNISFTSAITIENISGFIMLLNKCQKLGKR